MVVYIEYAFAENALLDGLLLYLSLKCVRLRVSVPRLLLASAAGGAESLLFPVLSLPVWAGYLAKLLGGVLLAVLGCPSRKLAPHVRMCAVFFFLTFALGGLLAAVSSFFGAEFVEGRGFWVTRSPVVFVLTVAGCFAAGITAFLKVFFRRRAVARASVACEIEGVRTVHCDALYDSGNLLCFRGEPVSLLTPVAALALFRGAAKPVGRLTMHTAGGKKSSPVFRAKRLTAGEKTWEGALFAVGEIGIPGHPVLLNADLWEGVHADPCRSEKLAAKDKGDGERHPLFKRE